MLSIYDPSCSRTTFAQCFSVRKRTDDTRSPKERYRTEKFPRMLEWLKINYYLWLSYSYSVIKINVTNLFNASHLLSTLLATLQVCVRNPAIALLMNNIVEFHTNLLGKAFYSSLFGCFFFLATFTLFGCERS